MPLPLPDTGSLSLFKGPSSMTSRINNDLLGVPSSGFDEYNLKGTKRMDVSTAPPSPVNCSISIERRVNSADILRVRRNSDKSSLLNNKKQSDWWKSFLSRIQQFPFLKRNDQKISKDVSTSEIDLSATSRSSSSVDVRAISCDNTVVDHDKDMNATTLDNNNINNSSVDSDVTLKGSSASLFDVCAQTPRHFSKEPEVLGKVGRFTIVREREDFSTTMFDQCHCQEKPCRFSTKGGVHPVMPPETLPDLIPLSSQFCTVNESSPPIRIPIHKDSMNLASYKLSCQQYGAQIRQNSWESIAPYRPGVSQSSSIYTQNSLYTQQSSAATSRTSLSSLKYSTDLSNVNLTNNKISTSYSSDLALTRSRSKNIVNKPIKPPSPVANGPVRSKRSSSSNIKVSDNNLLQELLNDRRQQLLPTTTTSKFETNEPHTTISSHTGRKFEVWSSSSSEPASSPSSTMSSSILSMSSSPNNSLYSLQGTSTRCSTLSSKHGRKFEVTIISSGNTEKSNNAGN
ncbi:13189_t:CDS:1 [Dentiscutata heterogama]|uniref:13189_t:CDS:1 n=1 Tax=Dentiscutata heterogama TaxID=1316150 RepID=A0ACA9K3I6_9GLOM|nr:13189_t:CDS:1 [Dentiscutata heterogama]